MNRILDVDDVGMTLRCEAGAVTQTLQEAAADKGLFFPVDLAAKGSCQAGGNVATNAGGLKFIRYGGTREQILGLKVVLATGEVLELDKSLYKDNTGYDLKQLFIGSEGTLGIVTEVVFRMVAKPKGLQLACLAVEDFASVPKILQASQKGGALLTAFEFFDQNCFSLVMKHGAGSKDPFDRRFPCYVLLELEASNSQPLEQLFEELYDQRLVVDGTIATSSQSFQDLWNLREFIPEVVAVHGHIRKNDISVPGKLLNEFIQALESLIPKDVENIQVVVFGHIGDGNLHINYIGEKEMAVEVFNRQARDIEKKYF